MSNVIAPEVEERRLKELAALKLDYRKPEERFDRITRVAAKAFGVPIAMINIIDEKSDNHKSCVGIEQGGHVDRSVSFCAHTVAQDDAFVIEDATKDPRFRANPVVTGEPYVRAYCGVPLSSTTGAHIGSLCLVDRKPRKFSDDDIARLKDLSVWAEIELNSSQLTQALEELRKAESELTDKIHSLEAMNKIMVGRELKMKELKEQIKALKGE